MVEWFVAQAGGAWTREQGCRFGQLLRRIGCISHVVDEHEFADEFLFFKVNVRMFFQTIHIRNCHPNADGSTDCLCTAKPTIDFAQKKFSHHRPPERSYSCSIYGMLNG
jgi:hypothetical protein